MDEHDLTEAVRPSARRSAKRARAVISERGSNDTSRRMTDHLAACIAVDDLCTSGHLAYRTIRAVARV